jgi:ribA/ribD-fused uncharacterized protein
MATSSQNTIYFWNADGTNYAFLSQWYPSLFRASDITFVTAEQYMMYQKAILFNDTAIAAEILATSSRKPFLSSFLPESNVDTPSLAAKQKALGRKVANFNADVWRKNRERIVGYGSYYKFKNSLLEEENLEEKLLGSGERELVEASPFDCIWGIGFAEKDAEANRKNWGLNLLGKALMRTRGMLREERKREGERIERVLEREEYR